jgi:hypothetical protein
VSLRVARVRDRLLIHLTPEMREDAGGSHRVLGI